MKRLSIVCLAFVLAVTFGFGNAYAASAKATAQCTDIAVVELATANEDGYSPVFTTVVRTSESKELFIDVSLECGLTTNTKVMSKQLERALATAEAGVEVKVLVDGVEAAPGVITFAKRKQTLIAEFAGFVNDYSDSCFTYNEDGTKTINADCVDEESLQLILDTMTANSFNFIASDLSSGDHTVEVLARVTYTAQDPEYTGADAPPTDAYLGKGSVTIETVRMIKGNVVDLTQAQ